MKYGEVNVRNRGSGFRCGRTYACGDRFLRVANGNRKGRKVVSGKPVKMEAHDAGGGTRILVQVDMSIFTIGHYMLAFYKSHRNTYALQHYRVPRSFLAKLGVVAESGTEFWIHFKQ